MHVTCFRPAFLSTKSLDIVMPSVTKYSVKRHSTKGVQSRGYSLHKFPPNFSFFSGLTFESSPAGFFDSVYGLLAVHCTGSFYRTASGIVLKSVQRLCRPPESPELATNSRLCFRRSFSYQRRWTSNQTRLGRPILLKLSYILG